MKTKVIRKSFISIIILVFLVLAGIAYILISTYDNPTKQTSQSTINQSEVTISGSIIDNDTSCNHDGVCKVKVDNYWIIIDLGGDPSLEMIEQQDPRGSIISSDGIATGNVGDNVIGKQVDVFAKVIDENTLTLYGKKDYYIRFKN